MGDDDALNPTGGAGGVENSGRVVLVRLDGREGGGSTLEKGSEERGVKKDDGEVVRELGSEGSGREGDGRVGEAELVGDLVGRAERVGRGYDRADRQESEVENGDLERGWGEDVDDVALGDAKIGAETGGEGGYLGEE